MQSLSTQAASSGFKYLSSLCDLYHAEALLQGHDYRRARSELEQTLTTTERLGLHALAIRTNYLMGTALRLSGADSDAGNYYRETVRMLVAMRSEAGAEKALQRNDLRMMYDDSTKRLGSGKS